MNKLEFYFIREVELNFKRGRKRIEMENFAKEENEKSEEKKIKRKRKRKDERPVRPYTTWYYEVLYYYIRANKRREHHKI